MRSNITHLLSRELQVLDKSCIVVLLKGRGHVSAAQAPLKFNLCKQTTGENTPMLMAAVHHRQSSIGSTRLDPCIATRPLYPIERGVSVSHLLMITIQVQFAEHTLCSLQNTPFRPSTTFQICIWNQLHGTTLNTKLIYVVLLKTHMHRAHPFLLHDSGT